LSAYDSGWPILYAAEARRLAAVLPAGVRVEHIGSTAVPGLLAKPIVDIMAGIGREHDVGAVRAVLTASGYEDMGEAGVPGRLYFRRRTAAAFNIALVAHGGSIWNANLGLRDYLRANPAAAGHYASVKRSAVESGADSLLAYSNYKSAVLAGLIASALQKEIG
jgi:GrpB-like predicted nucleotidyltransferase (UPF0157 family)